MQDTLHALVQSLAIFGAGLAVGLLIYAVGTWGRAPAPIIVRAQKHERHVRLDEPLLPQIWRFLRVIASGRTVSTAFGSFFNSAKIEVLLFEARHPWGLRTPSDVYAVGIPLGALLCFILMYITGFWLLIGTLPLFLGLGIAVPVSALKLVAKGTRQSQIQELWLLLCGMDIYLGAKYTLYDAIREASGACTLLRDPIEKCLLEWGSVGASAALDNLGRALQIPEAFVVISALRQAADLDPSNLKTFMIMAAHQIDKTMEAHQARSRQIKPMLQNAAMMIPMFNVFALWTIPLAYSIFVRMNDVGM